MEWKNSYINAILVPTGVVSLILYHAFLYYKVTRHPFQTTAGINNNARRLWVYHILKDNEKKNILAVQTLRNSIMESTLMATTAVLLSAGLAAYMSFSSSVKQQLELSSAARDKIPESAKFFSILTCFLLCFICHTQSIRFINHVNYMVNIPAQENNLITAQYIADLLEKSTVYYCVGARSFYLAIPLLLWVFGAIPMFVCTLAVIRALYNVDFVQEQGRNNGRVAEQNTDLHILQNC